MIIRAKTKDLLQTRSLNEKQKLNSKLNIDELEQNKTKLDSYPRRILLELTNACNLMCKMCGRSATDFTINSFEMSYLDKLKDVLEHAEEVTLFGWGEPLVYPKFSEILELLDKYDVRKYFVTNGMLLDKFTDEIFKHKVDIIAISLDGANSETNDKIRRGGKFQKVIDNISNIVKEKKKRGVDYPYMNFVFTAMESNYREIPEMVKLTKKLGLEELKVGHLTIFEENLLHENLWNKHKELKKVFAEAEKLADSLNIKLKLPYLQGEDIAGDKMHKDCFVGWRDFFIGSDGYVRFCQSTSEKVFHINNFKSFKDMWNSEEFQKFRESVNNHSKMHHECINCYQASHTNWNKKHAYIQIGNEFCPKWEK